MTELICIQIYENRGVAEIAKSVLESNNITAIIFTDDCGGMCPQFQLNKGVKLMISEEDVEEARKVLEIPDKE